MNNVGVIFMSTVTHHILRTREKGAKVPLGKGNEAMLNNCVSVHYTQDKKELFAARKRLLDALHGIPVQFRSSARCDRSDTVGEHDQRGVRRDPALP